MNLFQIAKQQIRPDQVKSDRFADFEDIEDILGQREQPQQDYRLKGGYDVPVEQRPEFLKTYGQAMQEKANRGETFTNEDLIPYQLSGIRSPQEPNMDLSTPEGKTRFYIKTRAMQTPEQDITNIMKFHETKPRKISVHDIPGQDGKMHKMALDEDGNVVKDYGAIPEKTEDQNKINKQVREQLTERYYIDPATQLQDIANSSKEEDVLASLNPEQRKAFKQIEDRAIQLHSQTGNAKDAITQALSEFHAQSNINKQTQGNQQEWVENGIKYRINPATGKKQRWIE